MMNTTIAAAAMQSHANITTAAVTTLGKSLARPTYYANLGASTMLSHMHITNAAIAAQGKSQAMTANANNNQ